MFDIRSIIVILGLLCIFTSLLPMSWQINARYRRIICIILCVLFVLQAGFRDYIHQINDTINYWNSYEELKHVSLAQLFKNFSLSLSNYDGRDPGFKIFVKLTQFVSKDFTFFLVLVSCIISIPISKILYRYTPTVTGVIVGAILYEALFASFFETAIRQTLAMGLSYNALLALSDNKRFRSFILLCIAPTIHLSSIIFLPVILLMNNKYSQKLLLISILCSPIFMFFADPIMAFIGEGTVMNDYAINSSNNTGTPVFTALVFFSAVVTIIFSKRISTTQNNRFLLQCLAFALMLTPASWVDSNFIRLVFYYLIFLMPLISIVIDQIFTTKALKFLAYIAVVLLFILIS